MHYYNSLGIAYYFVHFTLLLYCAINCLVKIHLNICLLFLFLVDSSMLFHILIKLCFGDFDENVVIEVCNFKNPFRFEKWVSMAPIIGPD